MDMQVVCEDTVDTVRGEPPTDLCKPGHNVCLQVKCISMSASLAPALMLQEMSGKATLRIWMKYLRCKREDTLVSSLFYLRVSTCNSLSSGRFYNCDGISLAVSCF